MPVPPCPHARAVLDLLPLARTWPSPPLPPPPPSPTPSHLYDLTAAAYSFAPPAPPGARRRARAREGGRRAAGRPGHQVFLPLELPRLAGRRQQGRDCHRWGAAGRGGWRKGSMLLDKTQSHGPTACPAQHCQRWVGSFLVCPSAQQTTMPPATRLPRSWRGGWGASAAGACAGRSTTHRGSSHACLPDSAVWATQQRSFQRLCAAGLPRAAGRGTWSLPMPCLRPWV